MIPEFPYKAVIFDLDGTLIDSAPSILSSLGSALKRAGIQSLVPLNESLIGPPLRQALTTLTGISTEAELDILVEYFKDSYDTEGYKTARIYDGVEELLRSLADKQIPMAIATNKRIVPTLKIINLLGWEPYFKVVGALDSQSPPYSNKAALIRSLINEMAVDAATSVYFGDKWEDGEAADTNMMPFVAAGWGYGEWEHSLAAYEWAVLDSPADVCRLLLK
jgi:phosphoglycolate phosphatase